MNEHSGKCIIIAAGEFDGADIRRRPCDLVIAADAGCDRARAMGLEPDVILGDFDSISSVPVGKLVLRYPVEKDDTDTLIAIKYGIERGYRDFELFFCLGGRLDHALANISSIAYASQRGAKAVIRSDAVDIYAVTDGELIFAPSVRGGLSVFAHGSDAMGVTISGLKYALENGSLSAFYPLGVSNSFVGSASRISVSDGTLIVMHMKGEL